MKNPAAPEQILSVCEDIQHMLGTWASGNISDRDIRAGSASLRRLLIYDELHKVWNTLMGNQSYLIPATHLCIDHADLLHLYDLYTCSNVQHKGSIIGCAMVYRGRSAMTPIGDGRFKDETIHGARIEQSDFTLKQFMDSTCMIAGGREISRNWIVQYVANSLGGTHFGFESKKGPEFDAVMTSLRPFDVGEMPASVREILGIGQAICKAKSTALLMSAFASWRAKNPHVRIA